MKTTTKTAMATILFGFLALGTYASKIQPQSFSQPCFSVAFSSLSYEQALQILSAAHEQYWYDQITMADLVNRYDNGICTIEKVENGYIVSDGGLGTVLIGGMG